MPEPAKNQPAPEADPLSVPENREKLELAKEFAFHLGKGLKNIGIYRHNTSRYKEFVSKSFEAVTKFAEKHGPLSLKVEAQCFAYLKQPIFEAGDGDNLPYKFFRDGVRHLIFRPGLTDDEFLQFVLIGLSDPQRGEDVLAQLWKASFEHIEYVVVEGFSVGELSEEEVTVEVDKIVGYLYSRLRSTSDDYLRFARVSAEDLEMKLEGVDQVRGAVVSGVTADDKYCKRLQEELKDDEEVRLFSKITAAVFSLLEDGSFDNVEAAEEILLQLLDSMLMQEDFATINGVLTRLRSGERVKERAELSTRLREYMQAKMGEEQRLRRIGEILNTAKARAPHEIARYLSVLDHQAVIPLLDILETIENHDNRLLICDALASLGKEDPTPFVKRLQSEKSQLVRDMIYVIDRCDAPEKMKYFGETLKNPNLAVRLEVLGILSRSKSEQCRRFITSALQDENQQMRIQAATVLRNMSAEKAAKDLLAVVTSEVFEKRDDVEKQSFFQALGSTLQPVALAHFGQLLAQKSLLNRSKVKANKLLAIVGLAAMPSIPAYKALQAAADDKGNDSEVTAAAKRALAHMKKTLFGDQPE